MRVWSLKTRRSTSRQRIAFHSFLDVAAGLMTSGLRLAPLPSTPRCRRRRLPRLSRGRSLLRQSHRRRACGRHLLSVSTPRESVPPVTSFPRPFGVAVGPCSPPEPSERRWSPESRPTRLIPVLGQAPQSAWAWAFDGGCSRAFVCLPVATCSRLRPVGLEPWPVFSPLHGLRTSRYRGGDAVLRSSRRPGIAPGIGHWVVERFPSLPIPYSSLR